MKQQAVTFWCDYTSCPLSPLTVAEETLVGVPVGWVEIEIRRSAEEISEYYTTHEECLSDWLNEQTR